MSSKRLGGRRRAAWLAALTTVSVLAAGPAAADRRTESNGSYKRGFERFERGDVRGARIELLKALQADPENELARLLQARVMLETGNGIAAQTEIEKAIQAGVPRDRTRHLMAHALLLQRQFERALREADPAVVPPQFGSYAARMRGRIQLALEKPVEARAEFERATRLAPNNGDALADLGRFNIIQGQLAAGERLVDRALALEPTNIGALLVKADAVRRRQGLDRAMAYYNQALQIDPNNIEALLERASAYGDLKRVDEARADIRKVQGFAPEHPLALYIEALIEARSGRFAQANALMTRTRGILNRYPPALLLQGMIAYQLNDMQQADEYLGKVVAQAPENVLARKVYAAVQLRKGDPQGAITTLRPLAAGNQADARTLALLGSAHARRGEFDIAQGYLERAARAAPRETSVRTQLAMTRAMQGDASAASADLDAVLREDPDSMQALMLASMLDLRRGRFRDALGATNRLVKAHPDSPIGYNLRGAAMAGLNDRKGAEANFRAAVAKKPDFIDARRNLARLLIATGRNEPGRQELLRILEVDRNDAQAMMMLAAASDRQGNSAEQISWLRRAVAAKPLQLEPRVALAQAYLAANQPNRSGIETRAIERDFPRSPRAIEAAGRLHLAARRLQDAESAFERVVGQRPGLVAPRVLLARVQRAQGRTDVARRTLNQAVALNGQNPLPAYVELIALESGAKRTNEALALVERVRRGNPRSNVADLLLGDVRLSAGQIPQAIAAYQAARQRRFDGSVASRLATAQMRARQPAQAIATLAAYRKVNPRDRRAAAQLADVYMQTRQYRPAVAIYTGLRQQGLANDPVVLNNLAWASHQLRDKRAAAYAEAALKQAPRSPAVQDTLGVILVETRRDTERGLTLLQSAAKAAPRNADIRYHLAKAYQANGRESDAVRELQAALKTPRFSSAPQARQLLSQLKS